MYGYKLLQLVDSGERTALMIADDNGNSKVVELLSEFKEFIDLVKNGDNVERIEELLEKHGNALIQFKDERKYTPLKCAAEVGNLDVVKLLVKSAFESLYGEASNGNDLHPGLLLLLADLMLVSDAGYDNDMSLRISDADEYKEFLSIGKFESRDEFMWVVKEGVATDSVIGGATLGIMREALSGVEIQNPSEEFTPFDEMHVFSGMC